MELDEWSKWCCLCGKREHTNSISVYYIKDEHNEVPLDEDIQENGVMKAIEKFFGINFKQNKYIPKMLCMRCFALITSLNKFCEQTMRVQQMFEALQSSTKVGQNDYCELQLKFGLHDEDIGEILIEQLIPEENCLNQPPEENETCASVGEEIEIENTRNPLELPYTQIKVECREEEYSATRKNFNCENDEEVQIENGDDNIDAISNTYQHEKVSEGKSERNTEEQLESTDEELQNDDAEYSCSVCGQQFECMSNYKVHMERVHLITIPATEFKCNQCSQTFTKYWALKRHMFNHKPMAVKRAVACQYCNKKFSSMAVLQRHRLLIHSTKKSLKCNLSLNNISGKHNLKTKKTDDTNASSTSNHSYNCHVCSQAFRDITELKQHQLQYNHNKEDPLEPPFVKLQNVGVLDDMNPLDDQNVVEVELNQYKEDILEILSTKTEEKTTLEDQNNAAEVTISKTKLSGDECDDNDENENEDGKGKGSDEETQNVYKYICSECGARFKRLYYYNLHMKCLHLITLPPTQYKCKYCSRSFAKNWVLKRHIKTHKPLAFERQQQYNPNEPVTIESSFENIKDEDEEQYDAAEEANANFSGDEYDASDDGDDCTIHTEIGKEQRKNKNIKNLKRKKMYFCKHCDKRFLWKYSVQRHMLLHTGHKPFKCNICTKAYRENSRLKEHIIRDHFDQQNSLELPFVDFQKEELEVIPGPTLNDGAGKELSINNNNNSEEEDEEAKLFSECEVNGIITCSKCPRQFKRMQYYRMHLKNTHSVKLAPLQFKCTHCSRVFITQSRFKAHVSTHISMESINANTSNEDKESTPISDTLTCSECQQTFKRMTNYKVHMQRIHSIKLPASQYPCTQCPRVFTGMSQFKAHSITHMPVEAIYANNSKRDATPPPPPSESDNATITCSKCPRKFYRMRHYKLHMLRTHLIKLPPSQYPCPHCDHVSTMESRFKSHMSLHLRKETIDTNDSKKEVDTPSTESDNATIKCSECSRIFYQSRHYKIHMLRTHLIKLPPSQFRCPHCPHRVFAMKSKYKSHMRSHVNIETRRIIPCQYCDKRFLTKATLDHHIRHFHNKERYYICDECGMELRSVQSLQVHKLIHTNETPFKCELCPRAFREKSKLKNHMEKHNNSKHICPHCDFQCKARYSMRKHMIVHSDNKRFKCDYCDSAFKRSNSLKSHLITHSGLKPYLCNFCDRTFSSGTCCRVHKKSKHPKELAALAASGGDTVVYACKIPSIKALKTIIEASGKLKKMDSKQDES